MFQEQLYVLMAKEKLQMNERSPYFWPPSPTPTPKKGLHYTAFACQFSNLSSYLTFWQVFQTNMHSIMLLVRLCGPFFFLFFLLLILLPYPFSQIVCSGRRIKVLFYNVNESQICVIWMVALSADGFQRNTNDLFNLIRCIHVLGRYVSLQLAFWLLFTLQIYFFF